MFRQTPYGIYKFRADGRVMVDPIGFTKKMPSYSRTHGLIDCEDIPEDLMFMCYPFVNGFSFTTKEWGEIYVDQLEDVQFDDKAFDYLVLDDNIKQMVKALVINSEGTFTDIIQKKSGGTIICLAGNPGIGKTVTAESISELLHKPLYSISVGELGVNPKDLEVKLAEILEIANAWNAIILLDEADIFLEKRALSDLIRNAMVSVFLRLLERYQGIMFLTTNRMDQFDIAFKSRISISINYADLEQESRFKIWTNLLNASNTDLTNIDIQKLSNVDMNGRQIKNCIRMGQCLAKEFKQTLSTDIIERVIPFVI
jgi:SpoVK/Ycf46/Vps4 family AAA+-type ATPase